MRRYLPQLDGLRAVAVLLVIGVHTGYIPGGYVGVDVFFVLSGYLITTIILRERAEDRWSLKHFYVRRARRLYPALFFMLLVTLPFGGLVDGSIGHYAGSELVAASYLSNFVFIHNAPFMAGLSHTWSLAVEEQFYLMWPLLLLFWISHGDRARTLRRTANTAIVMLFLLVALAHALVTPSMFLPFTRGGVLLLGCALALALDGGWHAPGWITAPATLGLMAAVILAGLTTSLPGPAVVLAGMCATALIAGILNGGLVAQILSLRPLVWLGKRSYGIYLWHWPLIWWLGGTGGMDQLQVLVTAVPASVALAAFSYRFVEPRFRAAPASAEAIPVLATV